MKFTILTLLCSLLSLPLFSQTFSENFNDGDFTQNPTWAGDAGAFAVVGGELSLNSPGLAGNSYLSTAVVTLDSCSWEFRLRMPLSTTGPSTSNRARVYLNANSANLNGTLNGYFIQIGETGTTDAVELRVQTGTTSASVLRGTDGAVANSPVDVRVRVIRTSAGEWRLYCDYTGGTNFNLEASASNLSFNGGGFFGPSFLYSSTNGDKMLLDDIIVSPTYVDQVPPALVSATAISATQVDVLFNEPLDAASAQSISNYDINQGITVSAAVLDGANAALVHLTTSTLANLTTYSLDVSDIADLEGNVLASAQTNFSWFVPVAAGPLDILINEIMADPTPLVGLPDAEYIELFNASANPIDLSGFQLLDNTGAQTLPQHLMLPGSYILICDDSQTGNFFAQGYTNLIFLTSFPSLTNAGENLTLLNPAGDTIHRVSYTDAWYLDPVKQQGGWSLEMINPFEACKGSSNWMASVNPAGGTPGSENSVNDQVPDITAPTVSAVSQLDSNSILVEFDDVIELSGLLNLNNYQISPALSISAVQLLQQFPTSSVYLNLSGNMLNGTSYVVVASNLADCVGNAIGSNNSGSFVYVQTEDAQRYDIIINEFYCDNNPSLGLPAQDFIELYNRSQTVINLQDFVIQDNSSSQAVLPIYLLEPGAYVIVYGNFGTADYSSFGPTLRVAGFPDLNVSADDIKLYGPDGNIIDAISYTDKWYQNTAKSGGGWTIERINPNDPCAGSSNWKASNNLLGGTPGTQNSVLDGTPDQAGPSLVRVYPVSADTLRLYFTEALDEASVNDVSHYSFTQGLSVTDALLEAPFYTTVLLRLNRPIGYDTIFTLSLTDGLTDCIGNMVSNLSRTAAFALPYAAGADDVIINEVLFNPVSYGSDFVELYNTSGKVLDLNSMILANTDEFGLVSSTVSIGVQRLFFPGEYLVLSPDIEQVKTQYFTPAPAQFELQSLPSYNDDAGTVVVFSASAGVIDSFPYSEDMHNPLLDVEDGVSLERIDMLSPSTDANNWHSAAQAVGFATPGYENSNFIGSIVAGEGLLTIEPAIVSPDGDGYQDFLLIQYNLPETGYVANIRIFDAQGRPMRDLAQSELLGLDGFWQWDGTNQDGSKVPIGIYIVWAEFFTADGDVKYAKKECVVATK